eukprot:scaffold283517_cov17-Tisochrysis_lutea.AAC.1
MLMIVPEETINPEFVAEEVKPETVPEEIRPENPLLDGGCRAVAGSRSKCKCIGPGAFAWGDERVSLAHVVGSKAVGEALTLEILRNGGKQTVDLVLNIPRPLVAPSSAGAPPPYVIIGGLVLTAVTLPYLEQ